MQESAVWTALSRDTSSFLDLHRVENRLELGFPDVIWAGCGRSGVFELKDWEGKDWVSKEQALWLRRWADKGGIGGVLAKKTRGSWLWFPARGSMDWAMDIQQKKRISPAMEIEHLTEVFICSLSPTNKWMQFWDSWKDPTVIEPTKRD